MSSLSFRDKVVAVVSTAMMIGCCLALASTPESSVQATEQVTQVDPLRDYENPVLTERAAQMAGQVAVEELPEIPEVSEPTVPSTVQGTPPKD